MTARTGVMLAKKANKLYLDRLGEVCFVQPKLDGDRCRAEWDPFLKRYQLFSSQGNDRSFSVPRIVLELNLMALASGKTHTYDGELYIHGATHQRIRSLVSRTTNLHPDHDSVQFHIFDLISEEPQYRRIRELAAMGREMSQQAHLHIVPTHYIETGPGWIDAWHQTYLSQGYEGIILRDHNAPYEAKRSDKLLKIKTDKRGVAQVLGFNEAVDLQGVPKAMVGSFDVRWLNKEKNHIFKVGAGKLTHDVRRQLWKAQYEQKPTLFKCTFRYLTETRDGLPREPTCQKLEVL